MPDETTHDPRVVLRARQVFQPAAQTPGGLALEAGYSAVRGARVLAALARGDAQC
jgi:hypothetical protein